MYRLSRRFLLPIGAGVVAISLAACSSSTSGSATAPARLTTAHHSKPPAASISPSSRNIVKSFNLGPNALGYKFHLRVTIEPPTKFPPTNATVACGPSQPPADPDNMSFTIEVTNTSSAPSNGHSTGLEGPTFTNVKSRLPATQGYSIRQFLRSTGSDATCEEDLDTEFVALSLSPGATATIDGVLFQIATPFAPDATMDFADGDQHVSIPVKFK